MSQPTFKELEHAGWLSRAAAYDDYFAPVTRQAVGPLLDALHESLAERDLVDICTGTGGAAPYDAHPTRSGTSPCPASSPSTP
jgi:hypothetical protein